MNPFLLFSCLLLVAPTDMKPSTGSERGADYAASGGGEQALRLITDFTPASADLGWYVVNDNVMGGRSDGDFEVAEQGELRFSGRTNTNGGGFSSIRSGALTLDLSRHAGIRLRVKGDGRRYTWRLTTDARIYGRPVAYWADFDTDDNQWQAIDIPFSTFVPRFRGTELDGPPLDTSQVTGMGLMIYDKRDGPFELFIDSVHAYKETAPFSLQQLRWKHRVLVISASDSDDAVLQAQLDLLATRRAEFAERDMLLVTLLDDSNAIAGNQRLTRDDVARARAELRIDEGEFAVRLIGKDGGVKLASSDVVPIEEVFGLIDGMPMRRREMQEQDRH